MVSASDKLGYFQSPAIYQHSIDEKSPHAESSDTLNTLVFASDGDLWRATSHSFNKGVEAVRITTHSAEETFPHISPDGKYLAFSANYSGTTQVYVMPMSGGQAKRVSFENSRAHAQAWTSDGKVLYRTATTVTGPANSWVLKTVEPDSLKTSTIALSDAIEGVIDSKGEYVYFVQHGLQSSGDNANQYKGGATGELWRYKLNSSEEALRLSDSHSGSIKNPMVFNERVYFISNESGIDNLWSMASDGSDIEQITKHVEWGVRSADMHAGKISYQLGADIYLLDLVKNHSELANISLASDFPNLRERWIETPLANLNDVSLSPTADKVVITARGKIAVANSSTARLVEVATDPVSRSRNAILSQDAKTVYAFNNITGENEIWAFAVDGLSAPQQLTNDGSAARDAMWLSPNGESIAHNSADGKLFIYDIEAQTNTLIRSDLVNGIGDFVWSKDSDTFAFSAQLKGEERSSVILQSISQEKQQKLTSEKYESYSPTFGAKGHWLYFLSDRNFDASPASPWGDRNMGPAFDRKTLIFAIALNQDAEFGFAEEIEPLRAEEPDDVTKDDNDDAENNGDANSDDELSFLDINWEGLSERLWQVPVSAGNYSDLSANKSFLYVKDEVSEPGERERLKSIRIEHNTKPRTFTSNINAYTLSNDGEKMLVVKGRRASTSMYIVQAGSSFPNNANEHRVQSADWKIRVKPREEWHQMFRDAWLMHRDGLFDANMRGIDWQAAKERYSPLVDRITDRRELNDIFKQMMGELNALHSQVRGGDTNDNDQVAQSAVLGGVYRDADKGVEITHIYLHDPELPAQQVPLNKPGIDVRVGDIIVAVNNKTVRTQADLVLALEYQAGNQVLLTTTRGDDTILNIVKPDSSRNESRYRYRNWVYSNAQKVTKQNPDLGYLHLYAMTSSDLSTFAREFYAQYKKQGLIIDVRRNRGGNIDSIIIEKLLRRAWSFWQDKSGESSTNMQQAFRGHLVVLADEFTYSDGETFTAGVKALELGTVIGKQTAGAGVWLSGGNNVVDGGIARVAQFPVYRMDGMWITEGRGISPDIEVSNLPHATFKGEDAQLMKAVSVLNEKIANQAVAELEAKPFPPVDEPAADVN
ncbi:PD40 domain-containing protein [Glaciecola sp. MH2013]|nr:PD40 domain-containing protein [Glaciecola sp. MH2013]